GGGGRREPDQRPVGLALADLTLAERVLDERTGPSPQPVPPAADGVLIVGGGVHHAALAVVLEAVRVVPVSVLEGELEHDHPRQPELVAQSSDRLGGYAEILRDQRQLAQPSPRRLERR